MKKLIILTTFIFVTNLFSQTLECRLTSNMKVGMYVDVYDNKMIDPSKNIYNKISTNEGIHIFKGYDAKHKKYFIWMIKSSGYVNGISTFQAMIIDENNNDNKTQLVCYDAKQVNQYRQNKIEK